MEWEGVRHPFHPDKIWSSWLLWPMYACYEWYVEREKKINHTNLFMNEISSFKKNQIYFGDEKNFDKMPDLFRSI